MTCCSRNTIWPSSCLDLFRDVDCPTRRRRRMSSSFYCYCCSSGDWIWISTSIYFHCLTYYQICCGCGYDHASLPRLPSCAASPPWLSSSWPFLRPSWPCARRAPSPCSCARIQRRAPASSSPAAPGRTRPPPCVCSCRSQRHPGAARSPPPSSEPRRAHSYPSSGSGLGHLATAGAPFHHRPSVDCLCL